MPRAHGPVVTGRRAIAFRPGFDGTGRSASGTQNFLALPA